MNAITTAPARQAAQVQPVLVPRTFEQLITFAEMAAVSGMVPRDFANKPGAIMIAVQMGSELGLSPMQSITSIAVIGNRPGVFGDALIGLCRQSALCQDIVETISGEGDARTAVCVATRRGATPTTARFSVADAKRAGLWGKTGPWSQYPDRMLQNRARGFALRDAFPDLLRGLKTVEELRDTPPDTFRGTTVDANGVRWTEVTDEDLRAKKVPSKEAAHEPAAQRSPDPPHVSESVAPRAEPVAASKRTFRQMLDETAGMLTACDNLDAVIAVGELPAVRYTLEHANAAVKHEMNALLSAAFDRWRTDPDADTAESVAAEADDTFPGDTPLEHAEAMTNSA